MTTPHNTRSPLLGSTLSSDDVKYIKRTIEECIEYDIEINNQWKKFWGYTFKKCLTTQDEAILKTAGKATLSFNSIRPYVLQLMRNVIDSKASAIFSTATEGESNDHQYLRDEQVAEILNEKYNKILETSEYEDVQYKVALDAAVGGKGVFRLVSKYVNDYDFEQSLFIESVKDPTTISFDPCARMPSKLDAEYVFECVYMNKDEFNRNFPDKDFFDCVRLDNDNLWCNYNTDKETVRVCDFYYKTYTKKMLYILKDGRVVDKLKKGQKSINKRTIFEPCVYFTRICVDQILENPKKTCFKHLPFVMVEAESYFDNNNKKILLPTAQHGFDACRSKNFVMNFYMNQSINLMRTTTRVPEEGMTEQLEQALRNPERGDIQIYRTHARIEGGEVVSLPPPETVPAAPLPQGLLEAAEMLDGNLGKIYGVQWPSLDSKEMSGKALYNLSQFISSNNEIMMQNLYQAISAVGTIILHAMPEVIEPEQVKLAGGEEQHYFDYMYEASRYNITIQRGVSHKLQQEATIETLMNMAEKSPIFAQFLNTPQVITFILENQDLNNKATILKLWSGFEQKMQQQQQQSHIDPLTQAKIQETQASAQLKQVDAQSKQADIQLKSEQLELEKRDQLLNHVGSNNTRNLDIYKEVSESKRAHEENMLKLAELQQRNKHFLMEKDRGK